MVGPFQSHFAKQDLAFWSTFLALCGAFWSRIGRGGSPEKRLVGQSWIGLCWFACILAWRGHCMGISTFALGGSVDQSDYCIPGRGGNIQINSAHIKRHHQNSRS